MTSSVIAAGCNSRASRSPSWPPLAVTTVNPSRVKMTLDYFAHRRIVVHHQNRRRIRLVPRLVAAATASRAAGAGCTAPTSAGRRMVKVEPWPGSLATVMSPPIIWQKRRLIASPSPVPPYLRVVEASAWTNS